MDTKRNLKIAALIMILLLALSCDISFGGGDDEDNARLELELTRQALQLTQVALANTGSQPAQGQPAQQLPAVLDDSTDDSSDDSEGDDADSDSSTTPCNRSKFVSETISDYTVFDPGEAFEKTWTVRNEGTCTWNTNYTFRFTQGTRMNGASSQNLANQVRPGETITMRVNLIAPDDPGTYTGRWEFFDDDGDNFGWYSVVIVVPGAAPPPGDFFAVTSVEFYMPHTTIDTGCPNDINIKAEITTSAGGTVTYKWTDSAGGASGTKSVTFAGAEKKIVDYNATISATGDYTASLYIDDPNHQWFGPKNFHVNCTP